MAQTLNYYELLGIKADASTDELKRAYFGKVRLYPPERYPEDFKKIRAAYETLSDPKSRDHYDNRFGKSEIDLLYEKANEAHDEEEYSEAINICEKILKIDPDFFPAINIVGLSYIELDLNDQAVAVYRKAKPKLLDNPTFFHNYGCALYHAGAIKQAIEALNRAIELRNDYLQTWLYLSDCYTNKKEYEKARDVLRQCIKYCDKTVSAYLKLIRIDIIMKNIEYIKADINELERFAKTDPEMSENVAWSLSELAEEIMYDMPAYSEEIIKRAKHLLPKGSRELNTLQKDVKKEKIFKDQFELISKDVLVHPWIRDIIEERLFGFASELKKTIFTTTERILLYKPQNVVSSVERIKSQYPRVYSKMSRYFELILVNPNGSIIDEARLLMDLNRLEEREGTGYRFSSVEEIFVPNIQVINTNKTGRNDPCPCGSGKKYKKCCMT